MSLPATHGCRRPRNVTRRWRARREVDVPGRPAEPERGRAHADAHRAVGAVGAAVRVGARNELPGHHEALLREIEVEDAVARASRSTACRCRGRAANSRPMPGLLVVGFYAGEHEVIVGDRRLARDRSCARR